MKTVTFKAGGETVMRITLDAYELDCAAIARIAGRGPGIARLANPQNCRPLFETTDRTYELRVPPPQITP